MTKKIYSTFATLSLLMLLAVGSVQAQSGVSLQVNIRFDFQVGNKTLPAGKYSVRSLSQDSMLLRSADGRESVIMATRGAIDGGGKATHEKLVFRQYGDKYFLAQVWTTRTGDGRELGRTSAEREAAKAQLLARGSDRPQTVEVLAGVR